MILYTKKAQRGGKLQNTARKNMKANVGALNKEQIRNDEEYRKQRALNKAALRKKKMLDAMRKKQ